MSAIISQQPDCGIPALVEHELAPECVAEQLLVEVTDQEIDTLYARSRELHEINWIERAEKSAASCRFSRSPCGWSGCDLASVGLADRLATLRVVGRSIWPR